MSFEQDQRIPMGSEDDLVLDEEIRYDKPKRSRLPGVLIGLVLAGVLMGGAFWWGYDLGRSGENGLFPPLIQANRAPIKEAPADPGGLQFPNQESLVFDGVTGDEDAAAQVGVLAAPPEQPLARSETQRIAQEGGEVEASAAAIRVIDTDAGGADSSAIASGLPPAPPPLADEDLSAAPLRQTARTESLQVAPSGREVASETLVREPSSEELQIAAVSAPAAPRAVLSEGIGPQSTGPESIGPERIGIETGTAPAPATPVATPLAVAATGAFRVQIGSYRTEAGALNGWKILQSAHGVLLGDLEPTIVSADLGARGVFHRLQAGPLADRGAATTLCNSLKAREQGCLVVGP